MKFSTVASALLCAGSALAAPGTAKRAERHRARQAGRKSNLMNPVGEADQLVAGTNESHVSYSTNWAGAVLIGTDYTEVTGTFTVPTPKVPTGKAASKDWSASAWVGIDGDTCATAILQTGIDFSIQSGEVSFDAWYEWYPACKLYLLRGRI
jgi:hypothetical protein